MNEPGLHAAITDFLAHSSYHPCLLLVHPEIGRLTDASDELSSRYAWPRLRVGRDLSAALLAISPLDRPRAAQRAVASLRDWGLLTPSEGRTYVAQRQAMEASSAELEAWLLACALRAHPWFEVQRQGGGWDMVRVPV